MINSVVAIVVARLSAIDGDKRCYEPLTYKHLIPLLGRSDNDRSIFIPVLNVSWVLVF